MGGLSMSLFTELKAISLYLYLSTWCVASEIDIPVRCNTRDEWWIILSVTSSSCVSVLFCCASTHLSPFPFCVESLQSIVNVLSRVESGGEVDANPTAAAASVASASGINPVSRDRYCCFFSFDCAGYLQGLKSQNHWIQFSQKQALKSIKVSMSFTTSLE